MALFDKTKSINTAAPKAKKSEATKLPLKGLERYAALDAISKALKTILETSSEALKEDVTDTFIGMGVQCKKRPDNFKAVEGAAEASIQLKTASSRSTISPEDQARLTKFDIPLTVLDEVVETYVINPSYMNDEALIAKVEKALKGIVPEDFILHQSQKKVVVDGDNTLDAIFQLKDRRVIAELLPLVSTVAIRASSTQTPEEAFKTVERIFLKKPTASE